MSAAARPRDRPGAPVWVAARRLVPRPVLDFIWSRLLIWGVAVYVWLWIVPRVEPPPTPDLGYVTEVWSRWDASWFLGIAEHGYHSATDGTASFYPLYPLLVGLLGRAFGGYYLTAGIVVSLACCLAAFVLLHMLARERIGVEGANRTVLYLAIFPMSLFLQAAYSESLFLLCAVGAFLLAERRRWLPAGLVAGLALLTRPTGFALLAAVALMAWRSKERGRALASLLVAPLLFAFYPAWLDWKTGDAFAFLHGEAIWHRHLSSAGPLGGMWQGLQSAWAGIEQIVTGNQTHVYWKGGVGSDAFHGAALNLEDFAFAVVFLALAVVAWRRIGAAYGLFALVSLAIPLSTPSSRWPLESIPRFCVTIFPAFLALALVTDTVPRQRIVTAVSATALGSAIVQWSLAQWVS